MHVCKSGRSYEVIEVNGVLLADLQSRYLGPKLLLEAESLEQLESIDAGLVWSSSAGEYL